MSTRVVQLVHSGTGHQLHCLRCHLGYGLCPSPLGTFPILSEDTVVEQLPCQKQVFCGND
jgi:hypothetical protein